MGIDFGAGLAVVTGDVERGCTPAQALDGIRLLMLANTVSLRALETIESERGQGGDGKYCVLLVLRQGENYGYEIVQALKRIEDLAVSESTIYPILGRLKAEGFLKDRDVPSPAGPPRRYFSMTPRGKVRLAEMNAYWRGLTQALEQLKGDRKGRS